MISLRFRNRNKLQAVRNQFRRHFLLREIFNKKKFHQNKPFLKALKLKSSLLLKSKKRQSRPPPSQQKLQNIQSKLRQWKLRKRMQLLQMNKKLTSLMNLMPLLTRIMTLQPLLLLLLNKKKKRSYKMKNLSSRLYSLQQNHKRLSRL